MVLHYYIDCTFIVILSTFLKHIHALLPFDTLFASITCSQPRPKSLWLRHMVELSTYWTLFSQNSGLKTEAWETCLHLTDAKTKYLCRNWYVSFSFSALTLLVGGRKVIRPVKTKWWGTGVVICLEQGANDLHMFQLMPLPPNISLALVKSRMVYLSCAGISRLSWKKGH